jgi:hypothetical protein
MASNRQGNNGGRLYSFLNRPIWIDGSFQVASTNANGLGILNLKGAGIRNVFMNTSATAGKGQGGFLNPNPAAGYALVQLHNNYNQYCGGFQGVSAPVSGGALAINASALTIGAPYVIASVGHGALGSVTIAPVADVAGNLASTWFRLYDAYGNTFVIWFSVSGVGAAPVGVSGIMVQQSISTGATAATIGAALVTTIGALLAAQPGNLSAPTGVFSFTAAGTTTVTVTSTQTNPYGPIGTPSDGIIPTTFTFAAVNYSTNLQDWQAVGLPPGIVPAVGVAFIASAVGYATGGGSTGTVQVPGVTGISEISVVGNPTLSLSPIPMGGSPNTGGLILLQFLGPTSSGVTTPIAVAPANNSIIQFGFFVEAASVIIAGE